MNSQPGTDWSYSDKGYFLLGLVIEKVINNLMPNFYKKHFLSR